MSNPIPIPVAVYISLRDDNGRPSLPVLLCAECQHEGHDPVGPGRPVVLVAGELWFDDDAGGRVPDTGCFGCGDDLTAEADPFIDQHAA